MKRSHILILTMLLLFSALTTNGQSYQTENTLTLDSPENAPKADFLFR